MNAPSQRDQYRFARRTRMICRVSESFTKSQKRAIARNSSGTNAIGRDWNGECMGRGCGQPAEPGNELCASCEAKYRPRCKCGKRLRMDMSRRRAMCSLCFYKLPTVKRESLMEQIRAAADGSECP